MTSGSPISASRPSAASSSPIELKTITTNPLAQAPMASHQAVPPPPMSQAGSYCSDASGWCIECCVPDTELLGDAADSACRWLTPCSGAAACCAVIATGAWLGKEAASVGGWAAITGTQIIHPLTAGISIWGGGAAAGSLLCGCLMCYGNKTSNVLDRHQRARNVATGPN